MAARTKIFIDLVTKDANAKKAMLGYAAAAGVAAVAVAGLYKVGKDLLNAYSLQEDAEKRLEATLKATGDAAGLTHDQLTAMATGLQGVTTYGDEAIISAESLLLTFKNIHEDTFPRALESVLDMSEAMGTDLKNSSIQLGKALNNPIDGISALTRVGVQFTDEQKDMIRVLQDGGDMAGAQAVILRELESQFGGVARAAAETSSGGLKQLNNTLGDLKESYGRTIADGIHPFVGALTNVVTKMVEARNEAHDLQDSIDRFNAGTGDTADATIALKIKLDAAKTALKSLDSEYAVGVTGMDDLRRVREEQIVEIEAEIEATNQLRIAEERAAGQNKQGAKVAADRKVSDKAYLELAESIETQRQKGLSSTEKEIEKLQIEIDKNAELRNVLKDTGKEYSGVQDLINFQVEAKNELINSMDEELISAQELFKGKTTVADEWKEAELARIFEVAEAGAKAAEADAKAAEAKAEADAKAAEAAEEFKILMQEKADAVLAYSNAALGIFKSIDQYQDAVAKAELQRMKDEGASEEELDEKRREIAHDNAVREKKLGKMQVAIDTATAIIGMLANPGGWAGVTLSAMATAAGAIQYAAVDATPIPAYGGGGDFITDGPRTIVVGDNPGGKEHVQITPQSSANINGPQSNQQPIQIFLGNELVYDSVSDGTKNGLIEISRGALV